MRWVIPRLASEPGLGQKAAMLLIALTLVAQPAPHPIDAAASGLFAVIEDDINPDTRLVSIATKDCASEIVAEARRWTIDWRETEWVGLGDPSFVYIGAPAKLAIVTDAEKPENLTKIAALAEAMGAYSDACRTP